MSWFIGAGVFVWVFGFWGFFCWDFFNKKVPDILKISKLHNVTFTWENI